MYTMYNARNTVVSGIHIFNRAPAMLRTEVHSPPAELPL